MNAEGTYRITIQGYRVADCFTLEKARALIRRLESDPAFACSAGFPHGFNAAEAEIEFCPFPDPEFIIKDLGWDNGARLMPLDDEDKNGGTVLVANMASKKHLGFEVFDDVGNFIAFFRTREEAEHAIKNPDILYANME